MIHQTDCFMVDAFKSFRVFVKILNIDFSSHAEDNRFDICRKATLSSFKDANILCCYTIWSR